MLPRYLRYYIKSIASMLYLTLLFSSITLVKAALETPPSILENFNSSVYTPLIRKNIEFPCTASGNPIPRVFWKFNDIKIQSSNTTKKVDKDGTLNIIEIQNNLDFGTYQCFAENRLGTAMGIPIFLKEAKNIPNEEYTGSTISGAERNSAKIPCRINTECVPKQFCQTKWLYRRQTNDVVDNRVVPTDRIAIDLDGTLHILTLESGDAGIYTCAVSNEDIKVQVDGPNMELQVTTATPGVVNTTPRLVFSSNTTKVMIGNTAEIQCVFTGQPKINIKWFKTIDNKERELTKNSKFSIVDFGRKLVINDVREEDEGQYTCRANNIKSEDGVNVLDVQSLPLFIDENSEPKSQTLPQGVDAVFNCKTRSLPGNSPPKNPKWYKNGRILAGSIKYQYNNDRTQLIIRNVQEPTENPFRALDVGVYVCSVENDLGMVYGFGSLNVVEQITILHTLPEKMSILPGQTKSMEVNAKTDPELTLSYLWSFTDYLNKTLNHTEMVDSDYFVFSPNNKQLTIKAENLRGSEIYYVVGTYKVLIGHMYEQKVIFTEVQTDPGILPPTAQVASSGFQWWWILIILLFLILLIVLLIIIFLCCCVRGGGGGGTYPVEEKEIKAGYVAERELKEHGFHNLSRSEGIDNRAYSNVSLPSMKPVFIESEEGSVGEYYGEYGSVDSKKDGYYFDYYANRQHPVQSAV